jgi:hypothetical protein
VADVPSATDRARSAYALHVIDPSTSQRHAQHLKGVLAGLLLGEDSSLEGTFVKVTLEIVDRRTGRTVSSMRPSVTEAPGIVDLLDRDLDRLDAVAFADAWGIKPDA